jgi:hypothetical protein
MREFKCVHCKKEYPVELAIDIKTEKLWYQFCSEDCIEAFKIYRAKILKGFKILVREGDYK